MSDTSVQPPAPVAGSAESPGKPKDGKDCPAAPPEWPSQEVVLVIDFGSQYSRLIARRVRESNVYCEILRHNTPWDEVSQLNVKGIILSGGPASVYDPGAPMAPDWVFSSGLPVLGICYGLQLIAHQLGGRVAPGGKREYGHADLRRTSDNSPLFRGMSSSIPVWMSHGDRITETPPGFETLAVTDNSPIAAIGNERGTFGIQFHPEVAHTPAGKEILRNFLYEVCGCEGDWTPDHFISQAVRLIREQVGDGKVICALSGGVDSAVAATLVHRAVGDQLTCIFVDNGLMRREEPERVVDMCGRHIRASIEHLDAAEDFLGALRGITDPEQKRVTIGEKFIELFEQRAVNIGKVDFLAQGTLYPDVIESKTAEGDVSDKIKTHHNVGGLPENMRLELVEPLRYLFKDEVREVGLELGLPEEVVHRQPFPGPGLAIRIIGEVTREKLDVLRAADWVVMDEVKGNELYRDLWQSFAVLTDTQSVGVAGDKRTYGYVIAVRAVTSDDAMTADWARLPYDVLARMSNRIVNEVPLVNRVVYDITSKPPGTIEWE